MPQRACCFATGTFVAMSSCSTQGGMGRTENSRAKTLSVRTESRSRTGERKRKLYGLRGPDADRTGCLIVSAGGAILAAEVDHLQMAARPFLARKDLLQVALGLLDAL